MRKLNKLKISISKINLYNNNNPLYVKMDLEEKYNPLINKFQFQLYPRDVSIFRIRLITLKDERLWNSTSTSERLPR